MIRSYYIHKYINTLFIIIIIYLRIRNKYEGNNNNKYLHMVTLIINQQNGFYGSKRRLKCATQGRVNDPPFKDKSKTWAFFSKLWTNKTETRKLAKNPASRGEAQLTTTEDRHSDLSRELL